MSPGPVISVISRKGGVGKTTSAVTLAELATRTGRPSVVVDVDHMAGAAAWADMAAEAGDPMAAKVVQPPPDVSAVQFPRWARTELDGPAFVDVNPGRVDWHEAAVEAAADGGGLVLVPSSSSGVDVLQTLVTLRALAGAPVPVVVLLVAVHTRTVRQREARAELAAGIADIAAEAGRPIDLELLPVEVPHRQEIADQTGVEPFAAAGLLLNLYAPILDDLRGRLSWP